MQRARRCWKLLTDSNRCVLNSRLLTTCSNLRSNSAGPYCAIVHGATQLNSGTCCSRGRLFPDVLQCSNLAQDSSLRRIRRSVPDELWALLIVGKIHFVVDSTVPPSPWELSLLGGGGGASLKGAK